MNLVVREIVETKGKISSSVSFQQQFQVFSDEL